MHRHTPRGLVFALLAALLSVATPTFAATLTLGNGSTACGGSNLSVSDDSQLVILSADDVTIDIEGVNVTNNHWTDPRASDVAPVPEPATLTLLATGLAVTGRRLTREGA